MIAGGDAAAGVAAVVAAAAAKPQRSLRPVARSLRRQCGVTAGVASGVERALMLLLDTNILIDLLRGEAVALAWLEQQQNSH